ncbi:M48 family metallopeptidase [Croceibacter atlanticus]|uniref:M48 family metallopeptidase n=1 Tax=Croceibacter atlanticus TaxID=313588 RepID=UPI000C8C9C37|nr:peptidase M48 [Croceibacter sp.]|tara:strand:- start:127957 stop:128781 length:825 start_codon:yes stop_codon:yes gene_type:complete
MKTKTTLILLGAVGLFLACTTNPFTGKKTLALVPNSQILPMAFQQYDAFLSENNVVTNTSEALMVKRVGEKIKNASETWLNANGYSGYTSDYRWEYNLVQDDQINAWCMPGGKIVVYTGILPITQDEAGLAAVMGHEVAHALANHGQQRMSAGQLQQIGAVAGTIAVSGSSQETQQIFGTAYGLGTQYGVMLPFSRSHETEADIIGQQIMAIAGYEPLEAAELWQRMKANSGGQAPPEFMSTHPSSDTRINNLQANADNAKAEARRFGVTSFKR